METYEPWKKEVDLITAALKDHETIETEWSALIGAWQTLDQFVRLQRIEQRLEWFDENVDAELKKWFLRSPNPLTLFANRHGYAPTSTYIPITMVDALNAVKNYSSLDEEELIKLFNSGENRIFGLSVVGDYLQVAKDASFFLERLNQCVALINEANWPASETEPND